MKSSVDTNIIRSKIILYGVLFVVIVTSRLLAESFGFLKWDGLVGAGDFELSNFNSIFELAVTFGFAFTAVKEFGSSLQVRFIGTVHIWLGKKLASTADKVEPDVEKAEPHTYSAKFLTEDNSLTQYWIFEFFKDITRLRNQGDDVKGKIDAQTIEDVLIFYAFHAIVCIYLGSLLSAIDSIERDTYNFANNLLRFKIHLFLVTFNCFAIFCFEHRHRRRQPGFEWTMCYFLAYLILSYIASKVSVSLLYVHVEGVELGNFYNYVILFTALLPIYPYQRIFLQIYTLPTFYIGVVLILLTLVAINDFLLVILLRIFKLIGWIGLSLGITAAFHKIFYWFRSRIYTV